MLGQEIIQTQTQSHTRQQWRKWLTIHHGIVELSENGSKRAFSYIEGRLQGIYTAKRTFRGEEVDRYFIDMRDEEGELYSIGFPYNSGTLKSIVLALASCENLTASTLIKIEPYEKNEYTKVIVRADGNKLDWITKELPPVEEVCIGGRTYRDEAKRMDYIASLVETINRRAKRTALN